MEIGIRLEVVGRDRRRVDKWGRHEAEVGVRSDNRDAWVFIVFVDPKFLGACLA